MKNLKYVFAVLIVFYLSSCGDDETMPPVVTDAYTVKVDGVELANNSEKVYTEIGEAGNMVLDIKNVSTASIHLKIKVISIMGNDGSLMELCLGDCFSGVTEGNIYPSGGDVYTLAAGESSVSGAAHVKNTDDRSGDLTYKFRLYQADANGNEITGKSVTFTYKYQS